MNSSVYNAAPIIQGIALTKQYRMGERQLEILRGVDVKIYPGEALCIVGPSGAGKSTLLHILGTLDRPTAGQVLFEGHDLTIKSDDELAAFRSSTMGFVFQFHHLLAEFTALENVAMPCRVAGEKARPGREQAEKLLVEMGLGDRLHHHPSELSGGEQQRVAIARALVRKPRILFVDEPTGNLDSQNGVKIQDLFFQLKRDLGLTLVAVTHDHRFAARFPRRLVLQDGQWMPPAVKGESF
jgi:lipoprotein-releasing system ATP-binding protein